MHSHIFRSPVYQLLRIGMIGAMLIGGWALPAAAQTQEAAAVYDPELRVEARGLTVTAEFVRPTPCTAYTVQWGNGAEVVEEASDGICIQVLDTQQVQTTYAEAGEYEVTLELSDTVYTETVAVPGDEVSFGIDDVASISAEWVDPSELMADEEYYRYTITLNDGEEITVRVAGFTTIELRNEQFFQAGYTGDVDELLARAPDEGSESEGSDDPNIAVYRQLVEVLTELVTRLQQLLERQNQ